MTTHKSNAAPVLLRVLTIVCAAGLGLLSSAAMAQVVQIEKSGTIKKENTITPPLATTRSEAHAADKKAIRAFRVSFPEEKLVELRRRIAATQWPEKETVADQSQGVPLATMRKLALYWATDYDWRKVESKLNAVAQFITEIRAGYSFHSRSFQT